MNQEVTPEERYKHFKGAEVDAVSLGVNGSGRQFVVYHFVRDSPKRPRIKGPIIKPLEEFISYKTSGIKRFERIE